MKIDPSIKTSATNSVGGHAAKPARKDTPANAGGADSVLLSPLSSQLQAIQSNLGNTEVFDSAKVEEIKLAISEGRFKINPDAVADKLLDTVKNLIRAQKAH